MEAIEIAAALKDGLVGLLIIFSLALTIIGGISYSRTGNPKIRLVTAAFGLFLIKGILLAIGLYVTNLIVVPKEFAGSFDMMLGLDVIILFTLYMALFRKSRS